ncbi:hypothetical protein M8J77_007849 [Diaphorina citri]|nr:hypothetical protein M8J77_007849 [Diaphorina citri]
MENELLQCSKETLQKTEQTKNSELESTSLDKNKPSDIEHEELAILENEIEVIVGVGPSSSLNEDCSGPSICTDGEIICELNDIEEVKPGNDETDVQCIVDQVNDIEKDQEVDIVENECEVQDSSEGNGVDLNTDLDLPVEQLISNDLDDNQEDPDNLPLPLIEDCPTVLLENINKEPNDYKNLPSSCNMNPTDSLALNDEPSESESDEPCPGSGGLYQDEDWISWRHNNSSGENSEVDEADSDDKVLSRKRKLCDQNEQQQPSCKKLFQSCGDSDPETSNKTESTRLPEVSSSCNNIKKTSPIPSKDNPPVEIVNWLQQFQGWSNAERILAIGQLIDSCEPTQIRHMMQLIEPQFQRDFISLLPRELALYVLTFLQPEDLLRAAQTCRSWRFLAEDNLLWREKCLEAGIDTELPAAVNSSKKGRHKYSYSTSSPWKALFMSHRSVEINWRTRPIKDPKVLKGHDDHVITCLQFSGSRIVSGSDDNTLKVWSATTGKCLRTLIGHTGGVWSSQMAGNIIISGSTDRTLKVWNADSGNCLHTLYGHTSTVRCMHLHGKKVVSGSRDATLRVWHIESGECLHVLVGHLAAVRCVQYDGKLVVSGAYDYMVKIWNPDTEECLHTLSGHTNRVYSLQKIDPRLSEV